MPTTDFRIERRDAANIAVVAMTVPRSELSAAFGQCFGRVFGGLAARGIQPMSMPLVRYLVMDEQATHFEAGVVVAAPIFADNGVQPGTLPAGEVASATFNGPYEDLPSSHAALVGWIAGQGREPAQGPWEEYVTDPGTDPEPSNWKTIVSYPLK